MERTTLGSAPVTLSEWDWLGILLRIEALETRSEMYSISYALEESPRRLVRCMVWAQHTSTMVREGASKSEQLDYYRGWVRLEKQRLQRCIARLPGLRKSLRFNRDVIIDIADSYGMGSVVVCRYVEGKFQWLAPRSRKKL